MAGITLLMDLAYRSGSYDGKDGEKKSQWSKVAHIYRSDEKGTVFAKVQTLLLAPSVAMLMAAAGTALEEYVMMSVFDPRDDDPEELVYKICYVAGQYDDPDKQGEKKAQWQTFAKVWRGQSGKHYAKVESAALHPVVLMQFRQNKGEIGRELFFSCFLETGKTQGGAEKAPPDEDDDIPF